MARDPKGDGPAKNVVSLASVTCIVRPDPPADMPEEAATEWRQVVEALPAEWFNAASAPLLVSYCRHVIAARRIAELIKQMESGEGDLYVPMYDRLLKMQERESRAISSLATRMRLTQQATFSHRKRKSHQTRSRPWEDR